MNGNPRAVETLTQERLKEVLSYCPESGDFHWVAGQLKGEKAGCSSDDGYVYIKIDRKMYFAHRLAFLYMEGEFPAVIVDHDDADKTNNRWLNLKPACRVINGRNMKRSKANRSGITGVHWDKACSRWRANIKDRLKQIALKCDGSLFGAACARKSAELALGFHENHGRSA